MNPRKTSVQESRLFAASLLALCLTFCVAGSKAAVPPFPAPKQAADPGLADWSLQPFSDFASHGVLWRRGPGLLAWRLSSARAFGSLAAAPNPAKLLFDLDLSVLVEGQARPRFVSVTASLEDSPLWSSEMAQDSGLRAKAVTLFCSQDVALAVLTLENTGGTAIKLRPSLNLSRDGLGLAGAVQVSGHYPAVWLSLDRGQALGRSFVEYAGVWMEAPDLSVSMGGQGLKARQTRALDSQGFHLSMSWNRARLLKPGQGLRLPILLAWGNDEAAVQKTAETQWLAWALPQGKALIQAHKRWAAMLAPLPRLAQHERLLQRAALDLYLDKYGRQEALGADEFSAQKGLRDAFFSVDTPLAALGWSELDMGTAQGAVLDLSSFSARASAAVPPYCGDEKLSWDAAGLPLNALAAWELYHRDPQPQRAAQFLGTFGQRLRNECAWWPPNRDGDGNGLYAFSGAEEEPSYMQAPDSSVFSKPVSLESWSLSLTSLVAWQMQVAAALAQAAGNKQESDQLLAISKHSQEAIHDQAWDLTRSAYVQGLDGFWPLFLGLDNDNTRAKDEIEGWFLKALAQNQDPWIENGSWEPWRVYFAARTLAAYGYFKESKAISDDFIDKMEKMDSFPSKINADGTFEGGDSAATAATILEFLLEREQQEVFLTPSSGEFSSRFIQFHSLDGSFYMRRMQLPQKNDKYALIKIETPKHGKIMDEKAFIFSCPESLTVQIQSSMGLDISRAGSPGRLIFKDAHQVELLAPARQRILVRFVSEQKQK
ncbi:MAG TPA: hypothetical protein VK914_01200 [bacterium]|jgi:hypothetical protein|nr:hypothetical protein [bacterium]